MTVAELSSHLDGKWETTSLSAWLRVGHRFDNSCHDGGRRLDDGTRESDED
jgi:hypothetical protein